MARPLRIDDHGNVRLPADVRKAMGWTTGTRLVAVPRGKSITLVPEVDIKSLRGIARGADTSGYRDRPSEK